MFDHCPVYIRYLQKTVCIYFSFCEIVISSNRMSVFYRKPHFCSGCQVTDTISDMHLRHGTLNILYEGYVVDEWLKITHLWQDGCLSRVEILVLIMNFLSVKFCVLYQ